LGPPTLVIPADRWESRDLVTTRFQCNVLDGIPARVRFALLTGVTRLGVVQHMR